MRKKKIKKVYLLLCFFYLWGAKSNKIEITMEGYEQNDGMDRDEIYSNAVKAGKRTYFFDVKATRNNDYYLTITESKKKFDNNGNPSYEKHKVFLYKEDFDKFVEGLEEAIGVVKAAINGELPEKNTDL